MDMRSFVETNILKKVTIIMREIYLGTPLKTWDLLGSCFPE